MNPIFLTAARWLTTACFLFSFCCCALLLQGSGSPKALGWSQLNRFTLPHSVRVYQGIGRSAYGEPIRAWYIDNDYADKKLALRPFLSSHPAGKEPLSSLAAQHKVLLAVNGGYFDKYSRPSRMLSPLVRDGRVVTLGVHEVKRFGTTFPVGRSAFGIRADRTFDIAWVHPHDGALLRLPGPFANSTAGPAKRPTAPTLAALPRWKMHDALGGGPVLLQRGQIRVTFDEEVFFGAGFRGDVPYARTAIGYTANHHLILMVVERASLSSVGLTLHEVAEELRKLGCTEAMNLDGGGSTTLVIQGQIINWPMGVLERPVTSMLALVAAGSP